VAGFSYMTKADTTTCDACGTRYVFKNYTDRCPVCCPGKSREDDELDSYEQADWQQSGRLSDTSYCSGDDYCTTGVRPKEDIRQFLENVRLIPSLNSIQGSIVRLGYGTCCHGGDGSTSL
jgi:hypothetical protein